MFRSNNTIDDQRQRHTDDAGHSNLDGKPEGYHKYAEIQHQRGVQAKGLAEIQPGQPGDSLSQASQKAAQHNPRQQQNQQYPEILASNK